MDKQFRQQQLHMIYYHLRSVGKVHTQKEFASSLSMNDESISAAMNGRGRYLTDSLFQKVGYYYGDIFDKGWLETGEGDMLVSQSIGDVSKSSMVTGNNVKGNGNKITCGTEKEAIALLRVQLQEKEAEIVRLHGIIDKLIAK